MSHADTLRRGRGLTWSIPIQQRWWWYLGGTIHYEKIRDLVNKHNSFIGSRTGHTSFSLLAMITNTVGLRRTTFGGGYRITFLFWTSWPRMDTFHSFSISIHTITLIRAIRGPPARVSQFCEVWLVRFSPSVVSLPREIPLSAAFVGADVFHSHGKYCRSTSVSAMDHQT